MEASPTAPVVAHVIREYLSPIQPWLYDQLSALRSVRPLVLARRTSHLDLFPCESLCALDRLPWPRLQWERLAHNLLGYYPGFARACRASRARLLHAHFGHVGLSALPLARALELPLVTSFYGVDLWRDPERERGLRVRYAPLFRYGTLCVAEGPAAREQLIAIGCAPERAVIHRLGVDTRAIPFVQRRRGADDPLRVVMVGRFAEKKGFEHGVRAFCDVATRDPRPLLTIVGDADERPHEQAIKRRLLDLVAEARLERRVRFLGFLAPDALQRVLEEHHVLMQPSVRAANGDAEGGHPVVLTQAAASGLPMIGTRHCDIPEIVRPGETGWLCDELEVAGLAGALREALDHAELLAEYSRNARRLAEARYDLRTQTLDAVYQPLLEPARAPRLPPPASPPA